MRKLIITMIVLLWTANFSFAQYDSISTGIMPFFDIDKKKKSNVLVSELSAELSKYKFIKLIERSKLKDVIKEIELGMTGMIDENTASKAGKIHGLQLMIVGTLRKNKITARIIHVESGKIISSYSVSSIEGIDKL